MKNFEEIRNTFSRRYQDLLEEHKPLKNFLLEVFIFGTAYVVGGFFRDALLNKKSRDIDIILDVDHDRILSILKTSHLDYEVNRHNGIKIKLNSFNADIWSLQNNWAFKNKLVKLNEADKLNSIAKGCFYNYDSLVINLHNYNYSIRYFTDFYNSNVLDIMQKTASYKNLNPTPEANILRAIYINQKFNSEFSENTLYYLGEGIKRLEYYYSNPIEKLIQVRNDYPKYKILNDVLIKQKVEYIHSMFLMREKQYYFSSIIDYSDSPF